MRSSKHWNVDGDAWGVGLVQPDPEVPFSAEQKKNEDSDVHKTYPALIGPGISSMKLSITCNCCSYGFAYIFPSFYRNHWNWAVAVTIIFFAKRSESFCFLPIYNFKL